MTTAQATSVVAHPLPDMTDERFAPHFRGLLDGRLLVQRCSSCGQLQWPPRDACLGACGGELAWTDAPTEGLVHTFAVSHRAFHPAFAATSPHAVAVVEVAPGLRLLGRFDGSAADVRCGLPVVMTVDRLGDVALLAWRHQEPQ